MDEVCLWPGGGVSERVELCDLRDPHRVGAGHTGGYESQLRFGAARRVDGGESRFDLCP